MKKRLCALCLLLALSLTLCSCGGIVNALPVVTGSPAAAEMTADEAAESVDISSAEPELRSFYSADGTVKYIIPTGLLDEKALEHTLPIVEVAAHSISSDEARHFAEVLFPGSTLYEFFPYMPLGKDDIQKSIDMWSQYTDIDRLATLYPPGTKEESASFLSRQLELTEGFISRYTGMLADAPDTVEKSICEWVFHPYSYYFTSPDMSPTAAAGKENDVIFAEAEYDGIPYSLMVTNRDGADFKIHSISAFVSEQTSPANLSNRIILNRMCACALPTAEQLDAAKASAYALLAELGMGEWEIDECYYEASVFGDKDSYIIHVSAVPMFSGEPALRHTQLGVLGTETGHDYYYTDAQFSFAPDGRLINCLINAPVDPVRVADTDAEILHPEELYAAMQAQISDIGLYNYLGELVQSAENLEGLVSVNAVEYGLCRTKSSGGEGWLYVPSVVLRGRWEVYDSVKGEPVTELSPLSSEPDMTLLVLNALDGTAIDVRNATH